MDSRHFPSRSTTDNLPPSLSSPPGERASLSSTGTAINDTSTTTPTTASSSSSTAGIASSHLPNLISSEGKGNGSGNDLSTSAAMAINTATGPISKPQVVGGEQQQTLPLISSSSDIDTHSSVSSDLSYDPERDPGLSCPSASDSCSSSLVSVASSVSSAVLNHPPSATSSSFSLASREMVPVTFQSSGPQPSTRSGAQLQTFAAESSASPMQPQKNSNTTTLLWPKNSTNDAPSINSSALGSSSKSNSAHSMDKAESESSYVSEASSAASSNQPSATAENLVQPVSGLVSPAERGVKRSRDEMEASSAKASPTPSPQKNRKRCFVCSCKLELAQRTIGKCRCGLVFCALHRLPELHDCEFNHKEDGRREAREKMIKPTRHLGPSYRREDRS